MPSDHPDASLNPNFDPTSRAGAFSIDLRVYYEDTDAAGVVYYANYLRFMERARTEWLRAVAATKGSSIENMMAGDDQRNRVFVVRRAEVDYGQPARLDDLVRVDVRLPKALPTGKPAVSGASVWVEQQVSRVTDIKNEELTPLVNAIIQIGCLDATTFRPTRIPADVRTAMTLGLVEVATPAGTS